MDKKEEVVVEEKEEHERLDIFLHKKISGESRTHIKKLIEDGFVKVNGETTKVHHKVRAGEKIEFFLPEPVQIDIIPEKIDLEIIYEDEECLVLNKPAGLLVHPAGKRISGTLVNALLYHFGQLPSLDAQHRCGLVHRLDEGTSGLMVIGKTEQSLRNLADQFKTRRVKKEYAALVRGSVELDEGIIDAPIDRHPLKRERMKVEFSSSKTAKTRWKVIEKFKKSTLVALNLETGRTHQLRVHMAYIGHPILGDKEYGIPAEISHQALCARYIGFYHPKTGNFLEFKIDLPQDFKKLIEIERAK